MWYGKSYDWELSQILQLCSFLDLSVYHEIGILTQHHHIIFLFFGPQNNAIARTRSAISMWNDSESIVDNKIKYKYKHKSHYVLNGHV